MDNRSKDKPRHPVGRQPATDQTGLQKDAEKSTQTNKHRHKRHQVQMVYRTGDRDEKRWKGQTGIPEKKERTAKPSQHHHQQHKPNHQPDHPIL